MAGKRNTTIRMSKCPLPKPKKIAQRGLYEIMSGTKPRNYAKRIGL